MSVHRIRILTAITIPARGFVISAIITAKGIPATYTAVGMMPLIGGQTTVKCASHDMSVILTSHVAAVTVGMCSGFGTTFESAVSMCIGHNTAFVGTVGVLHGVITNGAMEMSLGENTALLSTMSMCCDLGTVLVGAVGMIICSLAIKISAEGSFLCRF